MAYGAYMPRKANIGQTILVVAFFDSMVAVISGLIIFSIVFSTQGIEPSAVGANVYQSASCIWQYVGWSAYRFVVFCLGLNCGVSSAISLLEPCVAANRSKKSVVCAPILYLPF